MQDMITTEFDGCGKCLLVVRRLSRDSDASSSRERQLDQCLTAVAGIGGHVIGFADDWEVSGATDPLTRPGLGPWLRGEMGPYAGIVGAAVDRIGRNQRDVLNTAYAIHEAGRILVTYGHDGPWDLNDPADEMRLSMESFGAQMELRAIQKRNRDETIRAREAGQPKQMNPYGYQYVRLVPMGKVDHVEVDEVAAEIIREVAERILTDTTGKITCHTEAARLTRAGVPSPRDHRAIMYGREPKGTGWTGPAIRGILTSEASLGYLMHQGRPVIGKDGHPVRLAPPLWDRATRDQLIKATAPKKPNTRRGSRAPKGTRLLSGVAYCGTCGLRLKVSSNATKVTYICNGRSTGVVSSQHCKPAPIMRAHLLDREVTTWFLARYGAGQVMRREYDPGTGYAARITELEADRRRLREDRSAGLYDADDDAAWFRTEYARMGREITELKALPDRAPAMRMMPTGQTVADVWHAAPDDAARREMLTSYDVRVTLHPSSAAQRFHITGASLFEEAAA
jgi:DNA invertase Pin-like site-specific DNA recombinase